MPDWRAVNTELYVQVLEGLLKRVPRVTPRFGERGSLFLLCDSALLVMP